MIAMMIVLTIPNPHPALAKARGMARIPDPNEAFIRFANDLISLKMEQD